MKVLIAQFKTESNAFVPLKNDLSRYDIAFDDECIRKCMVLDVFKKENIEVIPAIYADTGPSYVLKENTFNYIESVILNSIKEHIHEIDGIYLFLHGASYVENIGSGDHHILKEIRKLVGPYLPIAVACDPHGNLIKEYVENCTIIRSFRESPHTDSTATKKLVAKMLCDLLKHRENIHALYYKLPLILGGEQSVSSDEPVLSINKYMDEMEKDPRIRSVSWHVGYLRHDCPEAGCGIVIVPQTYDDIEYCQRRLEELASYILSKRHEFHYTGLTLEPKEAIQMALDFNAKPVFITDSGDNTGSGAPGWNTYLLHLTMTMNDHKKCLFANINDPKAFDILSKLNIGEKIDIDIGKDFDEMSKPIRLKVKIKNKGVIYGCSLHDTTKVFGNSILINSGSIDINITNINYGMVEAHQFIGANIDWDEYDIIFVKQGYIFPECKAKSKLSIMALTDGFTVQDTKAIPFKLIAHPMYPIDE